MSLTIRNIENWRTIPNFKNYEVSDLGNVKSKPRLVRTKGGCFSFKKESYLKPLTDQYGYVRVNLYNEKGLKNCTIHNLVLSAFNDEYVFKGDLVTHHKNHVRNDNRLENLELVTQRKNAQEKKDKGSSKLNGVSLVERLGKWKSQIQINSKVVYLGLFDSEIEANKYYQNALDSHKKGLKIKVKKASFSSKYKGVSFCKQTNKWKAYITINRKSKQIGRFNTENEAYKKIKEYVFDN